MAIQFPPINVGDPAPVDGETYLYMVTQEEYVYDAAINAWSPLGKQSDNVFAYNGIIYIKQPAPTTAKIGFIYSVADGANKDDIDISFTGLAGVDDIIQWALIVFDGTRWNVINNSTTSGPWIRTNSGRIQPTVNTDSLDMVDGSYVLETLDELP